jgi:hypothetical protein
MNIITIPPIIRPIVRPLIDEVNVGTVGTVGT